MQVILLEDIKGVGKKGQLIEASAGHARNFLLPKKLAVEANKDNLNKLENKRKSDEVKRVHELEAAIALKAQLEQTPIKISVKTGESGKIFGSVTNKEIGAALEEQTKIVIDKKKIILDTPIKTLGEHTVDIKLHTDVTAKLNVQIS